MTYGAAKGDLIARNEFRRTERICVLEIAARSSGGRFITGTVPLAWGIHPLRSLIMMCAGDIPEPQVAQFLGGASQRFFWPKPGRVTAISGIEELNKDPNIAEVVLNVKVGDVVPEVKSHRDRVGWLIATGDTRQEAYDRAIKARDSVRIETK